MMTLEERVRKVIQILNSVEYESLDEIQTKITEAEDEAIKLLNDIEELDTESQVDKDKLVKWLDSSIIENDTKALKSSNSKFLEGTYLGKIELSSNLIELVKQGKFNLK